MDMTIGMLTDRDVQFLPDISALTDVTTASVSTTATTSKGKISLN
jgi:hypothetical protein